MARFELCLGDCLPGMAHLPSAAIDLVVTSPPYNLNIKYGKYSDRQDRTSYLEWCRDWATQVRRVLKPEGSFFLNIGAAPSNPMLPHEIVMSLRDLFVLQNTIHWIKSISIEDKAGALRSHGHFKPISSKRFLHDCHEYIFHFSIQRRVQLDRLAIGVPYAERAISPVGRTPKARICAVAATPGSSPMKPFRAARKSGRTRPRFQCSWPNGASNCMEPPA